MEHSIVPGRPRRRPEWKLSTPAGRTWAGPVEALPPGDMWETLEPRVMLSASPAWSGRGMAVSAALASISTTRSTAPIYLPSVSSLPGTFVPAVATSNALIDLDLFRADGRFAGIDGRGFSTVILDTGIDLDHPFFGPDANGDGIADRIVYQYDFADNDGDASDRNGHGSNVSSIIASSNATYRGVAPGSNIIALKVFTDAGMGNFGYIEQALQWCIANAATYNIASINLSLGDSANWSFAHSSYGIGDELAALAAMDVIVVAAAGNDFARFNSAQGVAYPAADPNVLAVGAVYKDNAGGFAYTSGATAYASGPDVITPFSQRHATLLDVFAPGAPITGANHLGGLVTQHGTSQAAPHIAGIATLAQQLAVQTLGRRLTPAEFRQMLIDTADIIVDGDDENDNVANTNLSFPRINPFALGEAILNLAAPNQPVIRLFEGGRELQSGAGQVQFGSTTAGSPLLRTFTVRNTGRQPLELGTLTLPAGFTLASGLGTTTLLSGQSTTFTVRLSAAAPGHFAGQITLASNDVDKPLFAIPISGTVIAAPVLRIADDGSAATSISGNSWQRSITGGYGGDFSYSNVAGSSHTWIFTQLTPGTYRVFTTFPAQANRAGNVTYSLFDGSTLRQVSTVDQRIAGGDLAYGGAMWQRIGAGIRVSGTTLTVTMTVPAGGGYAIADAVYVERTGEESAAMVRVSTAPPRFASDLPIGTRVHRLADTMGHGEIEAEEEDMAALLLGRRPSPLAA